MTDGWRLLEVGDTYALALTPAEAAELGSYLAGDSVRFSMSEKLKSVDSAIAELRHENAGLKQRLRDVSRSAAAQGALALSAAQ